MPVYGEDQSSSSVAQPDQSVGTGFLHYLNSLNGLTKILLLAPIVIIMFAYSNHHRFMSRLDEQKKIFKEIEVPVARFLDTLTVAKSTGRIALATPVLQLQSERSSLKSVSATGCILKIKEKYLQGMDKVISGFLVFMDSDNPDYESTILLTEGQALIDSAKSLSSNCTTEDKFAKYERSGKI